MSLLLYFVVSLVVSFLGSLPLGLITLTIVQRTIEKGRRAGIMLSLGATIMEAVYPYFALASLDFFTQNLAVQTNIKGVAIVAFFLLGAYFLGKKSQSNEANVQGYDYFDFVRGLLIATMNLFIIPFWIIVALWLAPYGFSFDSLPPILTFCLGSALGALGAFLGYVWLSDRIIGQIQVISRYTDRIVGFAFLAIGIFQLILLLS